MGIGDQDLCLYAEPAQANRELADVVLNAARHRIIVLVDVKNAHVAARILSDVRHGGRDWEVLKFGGDINSTMVSGTALSKRVFARKGQ
jgi:hypothetical protein